MKKLFLLTVFILFFAFSANAQTVDCPPEMACFTKAEAIELNQAVDERNALRSEMLTKGKAISDLKDEINKLRVELAKITGELIGEKSNGVTNRAVIEFLLKNGRKKCYGVCVQF